jgi:hypothetical protein
MKIDATFSRALAVATLCAAAQIGTAHAGTTTVTVDVAGIADMDERGADSNIVQELFIGAGATIESLKWNVNLTSNDPSYLSEMQLTFSDSLGNGVTFTPGGGDDFSGTNSYAGFQDLRLIGQQFQLGDDGLLRLEFHDAYKDLTFDQPEGLWNSGTLIFAASTVPEPQTLPLVFSGLLVMRGAARRRSFTAPGR